MAKGKKEKKTKVITHVGVVLDETRSMMSRKDVTISGFNEYLSSLKKDEGDKVLFNLTLFNSFATEERYKSTPINEVKELTSSTYNPAGMTPLYEAIGKTITKMKTVAGKDELVIITILTDGEENSSKEYTLDTIKALVKEQEAAGWKFVFLGVGIDGFAGGQSLGFSASSSFSVAPQAANVSMAYNTISAGTGNLRSMYSNQGIGATASLSVVQEKDRNKLKNDIK